MHKQTSEGWGTGSRGMVIAIEGCDAAGKATQTAALVTHLRASGLRASSRSFPAYDTDTGRAVLAHLRGDWAVLDSDGDMSQYDMLARQALMTVNRCECLPNMRAAVSGGEWLVLDRWWWSSVAYGGAEGLEANLVLRMSSALPAPDLWILLDVDPAVSSARRPARDLNESDLGKLQHVRANYLSMAADHGGADLRAPIAVVDASKSIAEVSANIRSAVTHVFHGLY